MGCASPERRNVAPSRFPSVSPRLLRVTMHIADCIGSRFTLLVEIHGFESQKSLFFNASRSRFTFFRDSLHGCSVRVNEKNRPAIKGETGIEGESRITRSPLYFRASGLRGKKLEGENR